MSIRMDAAVIQGQGHLDSAQSVFFARELEEIDAKLYDVKYANLELWELVTPRKLDPGTENYTYKQFDGRGIAEMTSNYATGSPRADVDGKEFTSHVRSIRNSFGYNIQEIRNASKAGVPLENMRAVRARRGINELIDKIGRFGDVTHNIIGLFQIANAQEYTVPANGTGSSKLWSVKTVDHILDDLCGMVDQIPDETNEVEKPTRMLLPYKVLRFLSRKRVSQDSKETVLEAFKTLRPGIEVRGALGLDKAGAGGGARAMVYDPSPEILDLLLPVPFESFPPQLRGMEYVVENHARMGGAVCRYPLTVLYADGFA